MMLIFTFLLIATLEATTKHEEPKKETKPEETQEEFDMCVGCEDKKEKKEEEDPPTLDVEIIIDPATGKARYVIKNLSIQ